MKPRSKSKVETKPFGHNPHITVHYNFENIEVGDKIKISGTRGTFKFLKYVHNAERNVEWLDCMDIKTGEYRSFYTHKLKRKVVVKPKRRKRFQIDQQVAATVTESNQSTGVCSKCRCDLTTVTATASILKRGSGYCRSCMSAYIANKKAMENR